MTCFLELLRRPVVKVISGHYVGSTTRVLDLVAGCPGAFFGVIAYTCLVQMGRTNRTFREAVDIECVKWKTFRRQLKPDDRERLDKIFDYARMHADSGTVISIPHKINVVFMSVLIEMQKRIEELESMLSRR